MFFQPTTTGGLRPSAPIQGAGLKPLRQANADLRTWITTMSESLRDSRRAMSAQERANFEAVQGYAREVNAELQLAETRNENERNGGAIADPDVLAAQRAAARAGLRGDSPSTGPSGLGAPTGRRFVDLFGAKALNSEGWSSREEFLAALHSGRADDRLRAAYMPKVGIASGSMPADGGFSVPTEFAAQWLDTSLESEIVRPRCTTWPMLSDNRQVPGFDVSDSSTTLFGGFSGQWVGQGQEIAPQTPKMRALMLQAKKLALLTEVANELIRDGVGYDAQLGVAIQKAIGWFFDLAFFSGTGAGQPLGILNSSVLVTVAKEVGQAAGTITYQNILDMFSRMHPASLANSVWVANSTVIPQLGRLVVEVGAGGSWVPLLQNSGGKFSLLTREILFTEKVPALGSKGDIGLYDFSQYAIGLRMDIALEKSNAPGFTRDTSHYRGVMRADGMPTWNQAYQPKNGVTLSPFVTLEAR